MNNFAFSGSLVPVMNEYTKKESSFDGGDAGLNYRFLSVPEGNENNYTDNQLVSESDFALFDKVFPCRAACKEKLGGKGFGFRDCLRECRGKGPKKSVLKAKDLEIQQQMANALSQQAAASNREKEGGDDTSSSGSKTFIWIILAIIILAAIGFGVYFLTRKKESE